MTDPKTPAGAPDAAPATALLARYRARLVALVDSAQAVAPTEPGELRSAVDRLVEELSADLLACYRAAERGELPAGEAAILLPALERLRNVLRHRDTRLRSIRDTLHKAVSAMAPMSQSAQGPPGLGSR